MRVARFSPSSISCESESVVSAASKPLRSPLPAKSSSSTESSGFGRAAAWIASASRARTSYANASSAGLCRSAAAIASASVMSPESTAGSSAAAPVIAVLAHSKVNPNARMCCVVRSIARPRQVAATRPDLRFCQQ